MSYAQIAISVGPEGSLRVNAYAMFPSDAKGGEERGSMLSYLVFGRQEEQMLLNALFPAWEQFQDALPLLTDLAAAELTACVSPADDAKAGALAAFQDFSNCVRARSAIHKLRRDDNGSAK